MVMEKIALVIQQIVKHLFDVEQELQLSRPNPQFGDFATNIAMQIAKPMGKNPREIAEQLAEKLRETDAFSEVSVAGPGFINFRILAKTLEKTLDELWGP